MIHVASVTLVILGWLPWLGMIHVASPTLVILVWLPGYMLQTYSHTKFPLFMRKFPPKVTSTYSELISHPQSQA